MMEKRHEGASIVFSPSLATVKEEKQVNCVIGLQDGAVTICRVSSLPTTCSNATFANAIHFTDVKHDSLDRPPSGVQDNRASMDAKTSDYYDNVVFYGLRRPINSPNSTRPAIPSTRESTVRSAVSYSSDRDYFGASGSLRHRAITIVIADQGDMQGRSPASRDRCVVDSSSSSSRSRISSRQGSSDGESSSYMSTENRSDDSSHSGSCVSFANSSRSNGSASSTDSSASQSSSSGASRRSLTTTNKKLSRSRTETSPMRQSTTVSYGGPVAASVSICGIHFLSITSIQNIDGDSSYNLFLEPSRKITDYDSIRSRRRSLTDGCGAGWDSAGIDPAKLSECLEDYTTKKEFVATPAGSAVGSRRNSVMSPTVESVTLDASVSKDGSGKSNGFSGLKVDDFGTPKAINNAWKRIFEKLCKFALKKK
ncbi:hypothetical protein HDU76_003515 [Blyttiomyces sp. JEL0837]|nr:hypothetical protein HDU76_003515 [Blyttiomyces sp. JEL0837]